MSTTETALSEATSGRALGSLSRAMAKGFIRDKMTVFFTVLFPMFFILIFGLVFGGDSTGSKQDVVTVGQVEFLTAMPAPAREAFDELIQVTESDDLDQALESLRKGDVDAVLTQSGDRLDLRFTATDQVGAATVQGIFGSFVNGTNLAMTGQPPAFTLQTQQVEDESLRPIQFIAPQMIAYGVSVGATFGAAMTLIMWRQNKVLRRLRLAPVPTSTVVAARVGVSLAVAVFQLALFIVFSMLLGLRLQGAWWMALPMVLCGTLAFLAIGLLVGAIAKTPEGGAGLANLITLPMAFLSGAFMPLDAAPDWLQAVAKALPMTYLVDGMKDVMVRGEGPSAALVPMLILLAFTAVVGGIAVKLFRWED